MISDEQFNELQGQAKRHANGMDFFKASKADVHLTRADEAISVVVRIQYGDRLLGGVERIPLGEGGVPAEDLAYVVDDRLFRLHRTLFRTLAMVAAEECVTPDKTRYPNTLKG